MNRPGQSVSTSRRKQPHPADPIRAALVRATRHAARHDTRQQHRKAAFSLVSSHAGSARPPAPVLSIYAGKDTAAHPRSFAACAAHRGQGLDIPTQEPPLYCMIQNHI